jgi:signal transduction histidine kinase
MKGSEILGFIDTLNLGLIFLDSELKITGWNQWLGYRIAKDDSIKIGMPFLDFANDKSGSRLHNCLLEALENGRSSLLSNTLNPCHIPIWHGSAQIIYNLVITRFHQKGTGTPVVIVQIMDVTQIKCRETFLAAQQIELDSEKEKAFQQSKLATFGEIASSIAHEINNPLAILEGNFLVMKKKLELSGTLDEKVGKKIESSRLAIRRINNIIKSIRNLTLDDEGQFTSTTIPSMVSEIRELLVSKLEEMKITVVVNNENGALDEQVSCMKQSFMQVLINLHYNSIYELNEHGGGTITISAEKSEKFLILSFMDSGPGIPKDIRENIFLPFFTTKPNKKGVGLGLSNSFQIMQKHGGSIEVNTAIDGTEFFVKIPLAIKGSKDKAA